jgi:outer membrane protein assembly factor BamB
MNRDGKAAGFHAPANWPAELAKQWSVPVGDGVASPALVGDRLFVFTRQDDREVTRCLDAASGEEIWKDSYETEGATGPASRFPGPRSSPTVADGKVVTLGVRGVLSCLNAASGEVVWRKDDLANSWPRFFTASSPIIVGGLCIAQLGGAEDGCMVAYDLASGDERWRSSGDSPSYGSPVLISVSGTDVLLAPTEEHLVGLDATNGKLLWQIQYTQGRYNSATPIADGQTVILAGPGSGISAIAVNKQEDELTEQQVWSNTDNSVQFNSPVLKDGMIYGLSNNNTLFAINARSGETAWSAPLGGVAAEQAGGGPPMGGGRGGVARRGDRSDRSGRPPGEGPPGREARGDQGGVQPASAEQPAADQPAADQSAVQPADGQQAQGRGGGGDERRGRRGGIGRGRGGRGGGMGGGGYGSIVDAGGVMLALTPAAELVVFQPSNQEFKELARYKVSQTPTYAYPVATDNRVYVKDQDSVMLWTVE